MIYVLDSSFVATQIIPDEKRPQIDKLYGKITRSDQKLAPQLIWYEMANLFRNLIRRQRYTPERVMQFFPFLGAIHLTCDNEAGVEYSRRLFHLCNDYNLSSYDAAYLELAERKNAVLCTMDDSLKAAAKKHGVTVLK